MRRKAGSNRWLPGIRTFKCEISHYKKEKTDEPIANPHFLSDMVPNSNGWQCVRALDLKTTGPVMYSKKMFAGWGDMDFNSHMKNTAYLDKSADVRMLFFAENGFPVSEFSRLKIGPVILKDEVEYQKEVSLLQEITVTLAIAGLSEDGSRFILRNEILRPDGRLSARVTSTGGWLDLTARKLAAPPENLLVALKSLPRTDDFVTLTSSLRGRA